MGSMIKEMWFQSYQKKKKYFPFNNIRAAPTQCAWGGGFLYPSMKRQGREADHSPPSIVVFKNGTGIAPGHAVS
jgi:hypothetical protein